MDIEQGIVTQPANGSTWIGGGFRQPTAAAAGPLAGSSVAVAAAARAVPHASPRTPTQARWLCSHPGQAALDCHPPGPKLNQVVFNEQPGGARMLVRQNVRPMPPK